jgi:hydroxyacylglutathione hydrolase
MLTIKKFVVNPIQENTYLLFDETNECVIIDAGFYFGEEEDEVDYFIERKNLKPVRLINTHCHFDHILGIEYLRKKYMLDFEAHELEAFLVDKVVEQALMFGVEMKPVSPIDKFLGGNEDVRFGNSKLQVIHIPGHSPGNIVFYEKTGGSLFAGDVLFYGSIGRTDLPGGDYQTLISSIKSKLFGLPGGTTVYCGHGPETTIGFEMAYNPFLT